MFANIPNTITSFNSVFANCRSLESIPEGLFDKATNVTSYRKAFYRCNNIVSIPSNLFNNNTKVTNFQYTFYDLQKITIVPELWHRETEGLDGTGCFGSCDVLDTTYIPEPWANSKT